MALMYKSMTSLELAKSLQISQHLASQLLGSYFRMGLLCRSRPRPFRYSLNKWGFDRLEYIINNPWKPKKETEQL